MAGAAQQAAAPVEHVNLVDLAHGPHLRFVVEQNQMNFKLIGPARLVAQNDVQHTLSAAAADRVDNECQPARHEVQPSLQDCIDA